MDSAKVDLKKFNVIADDDPRTDEEIVKDIGIKPGDLVLDLNGSVEDLADAIANRVKADLAAEGWSPKDLDRTDEEDPDPELDAEERANEEWARQHGIRLQR